MWKVPLGNTAHEATGSVHAVMVDGDVAFANMASGIGEIECPSAITTSKIRLLVFSNGVNHSIQCPYRAII